MLLFAHILGLPFEEFLTPMTIVVTASVVQYVVGAVASSGKRSR